MKESLLLKTLGALCEVATNLCDSRRGLFCETIDGKDVCIQRDAVTHDVDVDMLQSPCAPDSPMSFCEESPSDARLECRRALSLNMKIPSCAAQCRRAREVAPLGGICNLHEFATCEEGASCELPSGVSNTTISALLRLGQRDIVWRRSQ